MEDIAELDDSQRLLVFRAFEKLKSEPEKRGAPLGSGSTRFRRLEVGSRHIRIVYRVEESGGVDVLWIVAS